MKTCQHKATIHDCDECVAQAISKLLYDASAMPTGSKSRNVKNAAAVDYMAQLDESRRGRVSDLVYRYLGKRK